MKKELHCVECGRLIAKYDGTIDGQYTWFCFCSDCCYNVKGWTKKEIQELNKKVKKNE